MPHWSQERFNKDFGRESISKYFVYESYDEATKLFFNRGSLGFVLHGIPLVGTNINAQNEISEFLKSEENLPVDSSIQVLMIGLNNVDHYLHHWQHLRNGAIYQELASKRVEHLQKRSKESGALKDVILLISVTIPDTNASISDMQRRRDNLKDTFNSIGLFTQDLDAIGLLKYIRPIFGYSFEVNEAVNEYDLLSRQIVGNDFSAIEDKDGITVEKEQGCTKYITLEAYKRPRQWRLSNMDLFLGNELRKNELISSNFLIHFGVTILPNQSVARAAALAKREAIGRNISAGMGKFFPDLQLEYEDIDAAVAQLQSGDRLVNILLNVIIWDSEEKAKRAASQFAVMMRRNGFNFVPASNDHFAVLLSTLPMQLIEEVESTSSKIAKTLGFGKAAYSKVIGTKVSGLASALAAHGIGHKTVSSESKVLMPIVGEWKGDIRSPGMILAGRRGQIMYWSPFGAALMPSEASQQLAPNENFNLCIAGVPGSGKSVFMQELMLSTLGVGGKVFVLDYGRSFKRSCILLGGNYIEFDVRNPISINPFSEVPEGASEKDAEARADFLASFPSIVGTMAAPKSGTNDLQQPMLQRAVIEVWQKKGSKAEITDIAQWLSNRSEEYAKELGNMLFPFTKDGQYGSFFSGKAGLSLKKDIVVIETDHLRSVPELLAVIVQIMIVHINGSMVKGDRKRPFLIMIDEAWKLLSGKRSGDFIEEAGRIARKYNGSITLATQQLTDYFRGESSAAEKAFENASHKVILKQNADSFKAMRANPKLAGFVDEDWKLNLLQQIHSNPPYYSEAAIYGPEVSGIIGRLIIDPFTALLTSTNARDVQALDDKMEQGLSVPDAINEILRMRGLA